MSLPAVHPSLDPSSRDEVVTRWMTLVVVGIAEGRQVVYRFSGTMAGVLCEELSAWRRNAKTAVLYSAPDHGGPAPDDGTSARGAFAIQSGARTRVCDTLVGGKPARARFTVSDTSPAGGAWKCEVLGAGGSWIVMGEGNYVRAQ